MYCIALSYEKTKQTGIFNFEMKKRSKQKSTETRNDDEIVYSLALWRKTLQ